MHTEACRRTCALLLTEDRWGWEPCTGMLDVGTSSTWLPGGHPTGWEMAWTAKDEDGNSLTNYLWSCHDSLQKLPYLSSSSWDIFTGDWFVAVWFFSNLESHPNTQAPSNYHTHLAPKQIKVLAQHFSDPKLCRLWVITSKPVLQMFVLLSQACQQESWGGGWAWCPGKAAESDWESAGVAELFSSSCCTQPFRKGRARACLFLFLLPFWTLFCTQMCLWNWSSCFPGAAPYLAFFKPLYGLYCSWSQSRSEEKNSGGNSRKEGSQGSSDSFYVSS